MSGKIEAQVNKYKTKVPSKFSSSIIQDLSDDDNMNKLTSSQVLPPISKPSNTSISTRFHSSALAKAPDYEPLKYL